MTREDMRSTLLDCLSEVAPEIGEEEIEDDTNLGEAVDYVAARV